MDRASGWYRRQAQYISLGLGLLVAAALNADAIHVGRQLWNNPVLRESAVKTAEAFAQSNKGQARQRLRHGFRSYVGRDGSRLSEDAHRGEA